MNLPALEDGGRLGAAVAETRVGAHQCTRTVAAVGIARRGTATHLSMRADGQSGEGRRRSIVERVAFDDDVVTDGGRLDRRVDHRSGIGHVAALASVDQTLAGVCGRC